MDLLIEKFSVSDLEAISDTLENEFDDFWNYNILKKELEDSSSFYLCCKIGTEIVGFGGITIILDTAELNNIVVKKSHRGKNISSVLLEELIKTAKSHNCKKINLEVATSNEIAIHLYYKFGFKQVGLRPKYYDDADALLLTLDI